MARKSLQQADLPASLVGGSSGPLFKLRDLPQDKPVEFLSVKEAHSEQYGPFTIAEVTNDLGLTYLDDEGNEVTEDVVNVAVAHNNGIDKVLKWFFQINPNDTLVARVAKKTSKKGNQYWVLVDDEEPAEGDVPF